MTANGENDVVMTSILEEMEKVLHEQICLLRQYRRVQHPGGELARCRWRSFENLSAPA